MFSEEKVSHYGLPKNMIPSQFYESIHFKSGSDTLYGYFVKSGSLEGNNGILLFYFHGNLKNIDEYWDRFQILHLLGYNLFIFDYRGYGRSQGVSQNETTLLQDADAAMNYIMNEKSFPIDSVLLYGFSLGCVPALYLATKKDHEEKFPGIILESPFSSINSLIQASTALPIPNGWLNQTGFENDKRVKDLKIPLLLFHGANDETSRYRDNGKVVFENAPRSIKKELELVENAGHSDIISRLTEKKYLEKIEAWISKNVDFGK